MSSYPLPQPPPPSVKLRIPNSNKQLLQSIEKGTKLKQVPESAKNDRSDALVGSALPVNNNAVRPLSQTQRTSVMPKSVINNGQIDFQSQLMNQLSSIKFGVNSTEKRASVPNNCYDKTPPTMPGFNALDTSKTKPSYISNTLTTLSDSSFINNNTVKKTFLNNRPPPVIASNKPTLSRPLSSVIKPSLNPPISSVLGSAWQSNDESLNNRRSSANQILTNNQRLPSANQITSITARPPPPPPSKTKPTQRNSVSSDTVCSGIVSESHTAATRLSSSIIDSGGPKPSSVTRTTNNPPPPIPGQFRFPCQRPSSSGPPLPSRLSGQSSSNVLDRPPPPPPPSIISQSSRLLHTLDSRFRFPDECQFPPL